jgi:plastocyanin
MKCGGRRRPAQEEVVMNRFRPTPGPAILAFAVLLGGAPSSPPVRVRMTSQHEFEPQVVIVRPGDDVLWSNEDREVHSVVADPWLALHREDIEPPSPPEAFHSADLRPSQSFRRTFTRIGVYRYVCRHHEEQGMNGTVIVRGDRD